MMIKTVNLQKIFRTEEVQTLALSNVNIEVNEGEFVAVMGPSGCGKSTLLNILGLLDNPTSGEYYLNGKEVSRYTEAQRTDLRKGVIGFVFQRTQERRQPLPPSIPGNYQPAAPNFEEEGQRWGSRQDGRRGDGMWGSEDRGEAKASEGGNMREGALYPLMTPAPSKKGNNSKAAPQGGAKSAPAKAAPPAQSEPLPEVGEPRDTNPPSNVGEDEGVFKMGEDEFAPL